MPRAEDRVGSSEREPTRFFTGFPECTQLDASHSNFAMNEPATLKLKAYNSD
jgi:hypothetical protein